MKIEHLQHFERFKVLSIIEFWYTNDYITTISNTHDSKAFELDSTRQRGCIKLRIQPPNNTVSQAINLALTYIFVPQVNCWQGRREGRLKRPINHDPDVWITFHQVGHASCHMKGHFNRFQSTPKINFIISANSSPRCNNFNSVSPMNSISM